MKLENKETTFAHDLTGLSNTIFFNEILNKTINHSKRRQKIFAILLLNLELDNQFITDEAIKLISTRITNTLRAEDIIAKTENNEFIALLTDIHKAKFASSVAEKLLQTCSQAITVNKTTVTPKIHIGICIYPSDGNSLNTLLENVKIALQKAKEVHENRYQFYTEAMDKEAREYIKLGTALRSAIQKDELMLYYQPIMHIKRGTIMGVEALIRWQHPTLGMINPSQFLPLAEELGFITQLDEWALRETCKINKHWQNEGYESITVSINLSSKMFYHADLLKIISSALTESKLNPHYLTIEITENTVMDDVVDAADRLEAIKATGVQLAIDHFGVGYTSISHLKKFPLNIIKIDPYFINGIPTIPNDMAITSAFISLIHHLGFEVIAEGVETAEQVQFLSEQSCDMVQGYYLSHPVSAENITLQFNKIADRVF